MSTQFSVPLSHLHASKRNPRRVKPAQVAHHTLVALIKTHGLLQPLVVRPMDEKSKDFVVIAGHRRLAALKEIHRNNGDPKIPCLLKKVDDATADAISLGENFSQEPMHPLDEAEAFSRLATKDGKDADSIASEFGVSERYVRQRMKLSTLAKPIKESFRSDAIDTATAEAFASVPQDKQLSVWQDVNAEPRNAQQVRGIIANDFIDLSVGIFDRSVLPETAITQDLFSEKVLVERTAFMEAQANALNQQRQKLLEEGWSQVLSGPRGDLQDRLYSMEPIDKEFDAATEKKLNQFTARQEKLEKAARKVKDQKKLKRMQERFDRIGAEYEALEEAAEPVFSENTKSRATVFLMLDPDGRVHQEYRKPRRKPSEGNGTSGDNNNRGRGVSAHVEAPLTCHDLSDPQKARVYAHEVMVVRAALLKDETKRLPLLAVILHDKLHACSIALKHEPNTTTVHAMVEGFKSNAFATLSVLRGKCDPTTGHKQLDTIMAYTLFSQMKKADLIQLIGLLTVELLFNNPHYPSPFVMELAKASAVSIRSDWTPDAAWLGSYQKVQLSNLVTELLGAVHTPAPDTKKSTLVDNLAKLFADAAAGKLEDKQLAEKVNRWLPAPFQHPRAEV